MAKKTEVKHTKVSEATKIRAMETAAIEKEIAELKQTLFNLRFQAAVGKLENTAEIKKNRKQIARLLTVLAERK